MARKSMAKQERVLEAVRQGLEGGAAVEFIQHSGFAMATSGVARHLRTMGGRGRVQGYVDQGLTNLDILEKCYPGEDLTGVHTHVHAQGNLFPKEERPKTTRPVDAALFPTTKMSITVPSDLYEAIRAAALAEKKSQNQVIVESLTSTLSRVPVPVQEEFKEA